MNTLSKLTKEKGVAMMILKYKTILEEAEYNERTFIKQIKTRLKMIYVTFDSNADIICHMISNIRLAIVHFNYEPCVIDYSTFVIEYLESLAGTEFSKEIIKSKLEF